MKMVELVYEIKYFGSDNWERKTIIRTEEQYEKDKEFAKDLSHQRIISAKYFDDGRKLRPSVKEMLPVHHYQKR